MHDEGLFVYYTWDQLYLKWNYQYLPILHGPAMLQLQAMVFHLFGPSDFTMRLGCALLGIGGFFWVYNLHPWLGRTGTWVALLFYTISPGITYYQRFFRNDSLYLFLSLGIVTSFSYWWYKKQPWWGVSALIGMVLLFTNKESSLFLYFSLGTFLILYLVYDLYSGILQSKWRLKAIKSLSLPGFRDVSWLSLIPVMIFTLILTQTFEGLVYDRDVVGAIGHDWVLKDERSLATILGWRSPGKIPWAAVYSGLTVLSIAVALMLSFIKKNGLGERACLNSLSSRIAISRWHLTGAILLGLVVYLWIFTTGFKYETGFFEIYTKTWSYWGGQHEWGRIGGPFHQHLLNMLVYELPAILIVFSCWIVAVFRFPVFRSSSLVFLLLTIPFLLFHKLLFSGLSFQSTSGVISQVPFEFLKYLAVVFFTFFALILIFPRSSRWVFSLSIALVFVACVISFGSGEWESLRYASLYKNGQPVILANKHVNFLQFLEIKFNFDNGISLLIVLSLIFFATSLSVLELYRRNVFRAFLIWWFVTATGAACYAREAVPQVGIHAMLPLILLASSYSDSLFKGLQSQASKILFLIVLGSLAFWNLKACITLNFYYPDDPRERMVYGPVPQDLKNHCDFILEYQSIASVRMNRDVGIWLQNPNQPRLHKDVRVGVSAPIVVWPVRWYLRDVEWIEKPEPDEFFTKEFEFIFLEPNELKNLPDLESSYHVYRGSGLLFWLPSAIPMERLTGIWKVMIPGHYLDNTTAASAAWESKEEWKKIWSYLIYRETFDGGRPGQGNVSSTDYIFCVRKDLY